jgi:curved DNA-binding protein CbpA
MIYFLLPLSIGTALLTAQQPGMPPFPQPGANGMITPIPGMNDFAMTEAEFNEMLEFLSTLKPEELEELEMIGRNILQQQGIDPDTLQPVAAQGARPQPVDQKGGTVPTKELPIVQKPEEPKVAPNEVRDIRDLVMRLSRHIESLLQKLSVQTRRVSPLRGLAAGLIDLRIDLRIIGNKDLATHLATPESQVLKNSLYTLDRELEKYEERALSRPKPARYDDDDPYSILGLTYTADEDEIEEAFALLEATKSPSAVRAAESARGVNGKDLERLVKDARRSFAFIEDAYDQLRDPKMRAHVDRQHTALIESEKQVFEQARVAEQALAEAFTQALYSERLTEEIENFFKRYEPTALALKKSMEAEEATRKQEIEQALSITPYPTYGSYDLPTQYSESRDSGYGNDSYSPSSYGSYGDTFGSSQQPTYPSFGESSDPGRGSGAPGNASRGRSDEDKKEELTDTDTGKSDKKDTGPNKKSESGTQKKKQEKSPPQIMDGLAKELKSFDEAFKKPETAQLLGGLSDYLRKPLANDAPIDAALNEKIAALIDDLTLEKLKEDFESLAKSVDALAKGDKKARVLPAQYLNFYTKKWGMLEQGIQQVRLLKKSIEELLAEKEGFSSPRAERIVAHVGSLIEPQPLGALQKMLVDIDNSILVSEKLILPERFKKKEKSEAAAVQ